ncbi:MAG: SseB family protein [Oscillospiraceae bacterium]|nr:SseB family protein [Oscillospiraceae bacterium]
MSDHPNTQPNFEKIETVTSGYFSYIIGHFHQPNLYVLGAMDLNDPASWSGGETAVIFYFMITPEEYAWLSADRSKLDELAQKIQTNMPRSRFFSATCTKKGTTPEALQALCEQSLKADALENDEVFEAWKKTLSLPRRVQVPKTPYHEARHNLAVCQRSFRPQTATQEQRDEEADLEKKLGWLIFKSEALYVAYDTCFNPRFPMIETAQGAVHLYSSQELADKSAAYYAEHNYYFTTIKKLEQAGIKPFLRHCEEYGLLRFRVDDGLEPVTIQLNNIIPTLDRGFIENYNAHIRGLMLRTMQTLRLVKLHGEEMEPKRKAGLNDWFMTWNRMMLQDLGKTTLFVPCAMPAKLREQLKKDHAYTAAGLNHIKELMQTAKATGKSISRPGFHGRELVLNLAEGAKYPVRMLKTPDEKQWLLAFTSREQAEQFLQRSERGDMIVGMTLDELAEMVGLVEVCSGVLVDPVSVGLCLNEKTLEQALKVRNEKRVIYRSEAAGTAPKADSEPAVEFRAEPDVQISDTGEEDTAATEPSDVAEVSNETSEEALHGMETDPSLEVSVPVEGDAPSEIEQKEPDGSQKKVSFFSRLFGKK